MAIDRTNFNAIVESNGTPGHGDAWTKSLIDTALLTPIDAAITAGAGLSAGSNYINDTSNANMTVGLTINQGSADDEALAFKSSDLAHGMTDFAETDTFATVRKEDGATGGLQLAGYAETGSTIAARIEGRVTDTTGTRSTGARAPVQLTARLKTGTGLTSVGADKNLLSVDDNGTARFFLDSDGDSHQDVGTSWTNFSTHDDVGLLAAVSAGVSRGDDPVKSQFGGFLKEHRQELERLHLVTFNDGPGEDGRPFVNMSKLTMLLVGAAIQSAQRVTALERRLRALEA